MSLDSTNEPSAVHHCYDSDYEASSLQLVQALAKDPECKNLDTAVEAHHAYPATKAILRRGAQRAFKAYTITIPNSIVPLALALAYPISSRTLEPLASYSSSCPPHLRRSTLAHLVRSGNPTRYPEAEHNDQTSSERVKSGRILDRPPYTAGEGAAAGDAVRVRVRAADVSRYLEDALLFSYYGHILRVFDVSLPQAAESAKVAADERIKVKSNGAACRVEEVYIKLAPHSEATWALIKAKPCGGRSERACE